MLLPVHAYIEVPVMLLLTVLTVNWCSIGCYLGAWIIIVARYPLVPQGVRSRRATVRSPVVRI